MPCDGGDAVCSDGEGMHMNLVVMMLIRLILLKTKQKSHAILTKNYLLGFFCSSLPICDPGSRMVVAETRERGKWGTAVCVCVCVCAHMLIQWWLTLCNPVAHQALLSMGFPRQE